LLRRRTQAGIYEMIVLTLESLTTLLDRVKGVG